MSDTLDPDKILLLHRLAMHPDQSPCDAIRLDQYLGRHALEIVEALRDKARLDWLESSSAKGVNEHGHDDYEWWEIDWREYGRASGETKGGDIRECIDFGMSQTRKVDLEDATAGHGKETPCACANCIELRAWRDPAEVFRERWADAFEDEEGPDELGFGNTMETPTKGKE